MVTKARSFWGKFGSEEEFCKWLAAKALNSRTVNVQTLTAAASTTTSIVYATTALATSGGLFSVNPRTKTTTYTATITDNIILVDTTSAWTLTLPAAATSVGQLLVIKKTDVAANALTIDGHASETIDGSTTNTEIDAQYDALWLFCDGSNWHIIGRWIH